MINRESVNKCCWNVVFSSLGDLGIVEDHLAFVGAKNIDSSCHSVEVELTPSSPLDQLTCNTSGAKVLLAPISFYSQMSRAFQGTHGRGTTREAGQPPLWRCDMLCQYLFALRTAKWPRSMPAWSRLLKTTFLQHLLTHFGLIRFLIHFFYELKKYQVILVSTKITSSCLDSRATPLIPNL